MTWQAQVKTWAEKRRAPELGEQFVTFLERSFRVPLRLYPKDAWFGIHGGYVSLTIGNMWLAAITSSPKCIYVIVEPELRVPGMGYLPIKSTLRYVPLGFVTAKPWDKVSRVLEDKQIWDSYLQACELILRSPISRNVITRNLYRKARLSELQGTRSRDEYTSITSRLG